MSDYEALLHFNKRAVSAEMIQYLASSTASIIQIKKSNNMIDIALPAPPLTQFIQGLISHSNVQTPTLMATTVYLTKLRSIIPGNVYGIETTRHRIFLGCLILAAKTLNDSSPLNKHWASYTDGLLHIREVNTIERELLEYFDWNVTITTNELITCLTPFLQPIKEQFLRQKRQDYLLFNAPVQGQLREYINSTSKVGPESHSRSSSSLSLPSLASTATLSTVDSRRSRMAYNHIFSIDEMDESSPNKLKSTKYAPYKSPVSDKENFAVDFGRSVPPKYSVDVAKTRPIMLDRTTKRTPKKAVKSSNWHSIFS
ncbi:hypothetical protein HG536_0C05380 [Torulaspora globosa]|uniref:Cyclin-like domain-containing protein n=1 Tax=Torulaspora globosa TaxID=48254 RepID=A0A7G3ZFT3_9SACH|nr:uncharacterized protein HG536_0C05380 [Torulaspora globosa]QLL32369.1 hypothetical protein HG536_0C05380 [Torulaspora globosa]